VSLHRDRLVIQQNRPVNGGGRPRPLYGVNRISR
jgi:hypothetical protein